MKFLIILFLAVGCGGRDHLKVVDDLHEQAKSKTCNPEQLKQVEAQHAICSKTGYFSSHCLDMAIVAQCSDNKNYKGKK